MRLLLLLLLCTHAGAEDVVQASRDHYAKGRALYLEEKNQEALREFQAGYELAPRPEFLINMGLCHSRLGHLREARDLFKKFLAAVPEAHKQRQNVQELLDRIESDLAAHPEEPTRETTPPVEPQPLVTSAPPPATTSAQKERSFARRHWWIFPVVGVVVAGVAVGLGVGLTQKSGCEGFCVDAR